MKAKRMIIYFGIIIVLLGVVWAIWGGSAQWRARAWGGTYDVKIEKGHKFINVTWKGTELWILSRPAEEGEKILTEPYIFQQKTTMSMKEGKVRIYEQARD